MRQLLPILKVDSTYDEVLSVSMKPVPASLMRKARGQERHLSRNNNPNSEAQVTQTLQDFYPETYRCQLTEKETIKLEPQQDNNDQEARQTVTERQRQQPQPSEESKFHYHLEFGIEGKKKTPTQRVNDYRRAAAFAHDYAQNIASAFNAADESIHVFPERTQYSDTHHPQHIVLEWSVLHPDDSRVLAYARVIACQDSEDMTDEEFSATIEQGLRRRGFTDVQVTVLP
jgi:hypothetical protein